MTSRFDIKFIAGGVIKDADGNIVDDSSEKAALQELQALGLPNLMEGE